MTMEGFFRISIQLYVPVVEIVNVANHGIPLLNFVPCMTFSLISAEICICL